MKYMLDWLKTFGPPPSVRLYHRHLFIHKALLPTAEHIVRPIGPCLIAGNREMHQRCTHLTGRLTTSDKGRYGRYAHVKDREH